MGINARAGDRRGRRRHRVSGVERCSCDSGDGRIDQASKVLLLFDRNTAVCQRVGVARIRPAVRRKRIAVRRDKRAHHGREGAATSRHAADDRICVRLSIYGELEKALLKSMQIVADHVALCEYAYRAHDVFVWSLQNTGQDLASVRRSFNEGRDAAEIVILPLRDSEQRQLYRGSVERDRVDIVKGLSDAFQISRHNWVTSTRLRTAQVERCEFRQFPDQLFSSRDKCSFFVAIVCSHGFHPLVERLNYRQTQFLKIHPGAADADQSASYEGKGLIVSSWQQSPDPRYAAQRLVQREGSSAAPPATGAAAAAAAAATAAGEGPAATEGIGEPL